MASLKSADNQISVVAGGCTGSFSNGSITVPVAMNATDGYHTSR
ncbi:MULTISPECIES: hypothetical protein [Streptomyces]|uniref:Uncharacterized protein n=1 Tax=Streptomyces chartreusis NRRL 3882 TaxID=1079985 RepID=A0A2N9BLJ3_STRCX|nr:MULTISPECIES: hypothetical protein [Streptomyces]SOR84239.1 hypothetical protein SCNRRL3882_7684 [Streptomyces chartreusis NRRL 3882]